MASNIFRPQRSTEAPMDFEFTNPDRRSTAIWQTKKRPHEDVTMMPPPFPSPKTTSTTNSPFLFHYPTQKDVDMSPPTPEQPTPAPAPATAEETLAPDRRPVATGALRRVYRARRKGQRRNHDSSEDDDDNDEESSRTTSNHYTLNMHGAGGTPYTLLGYLQFFFNLSLVLVFLYLVVQVILTVQRDVHNRIGEYTQHLVSEISLCAHHFAANACEAPLPAMRVQCAEWARCMNQDVSMSVGRARVGGEVVAEVVEGFVGGVSWKTLAFTLTSLSFFTVFINALISLYRARILVPTHEPRLPTLPAWGARPRWNGDDDEEETMRRRRRVEGGGGVKVK